MKLGEERCIVQVWLAEEGTPYEVAASGCSPLFAEAAREAVLRWQWAPPQVGGQATKARTTVSVVFKRR